VLGALGTPYMFGRNGMTLDRSGPPRRGGRKMNFSDNHPHQFRGDLHPVRENGAYEPLRTTPGFSGSKAQSGLDECAR
jgi:hypothetical protein